MPAAKVLISYSHDSPVHEQRVLALSDRLRSHGIDAIVDQYESFPAEGWIQWMKRQIREAQFILVICTETYRRRADRQEAPGVGLGATYESQIIQQLLYDAAGTNDRIVPVLLDPADRPHIPVELRSYDHFVVNTEAGYKKLYRLLTNQPKVKKPALGQPLALREAKHDFRNLVWSVPPHNPFFTGRDAELVTIHAARPRPQAINGLGGVGKTQTAIAYAHRFRGDYQAVFWTVADSRDALNSGYSQIAAVLDLPEKNEQDLNAVAAAARRWLESTPGWLLILDNVEDVAIVPIGLPGHILITTRQRATGGFAQAVDLPEMDPDSGAEFLLRRAKMESPTGDDRGLARQISIEVDGLPLALDQAGAFIEETPSTLSEYLDLYRAEGAELRKRRGNLATGHDSVYVTYALALAKTGPNAAAIIRGCAFLAPDDIPEEIFTEAAGEWGEPIATVAIRPIAWVQAIEEGGRFSLIRRDAKAKTLHIHRLVQEVVKDEMDTETRRMWAEQAVKAAEKVFPDPEFPNWPQCEQMLPHARVAADLIGRYQFEFPATVRLLNRTGYYLDARAQYADAEPVYSRALAINEKALGPDHPQTAAVINNLALLFNNLGRYAKAEPLYQRALAIREATLGTDHPDTAGSLNNLASLYFNQRRYTEAEPLYRRALAIKEKALGPDHPKTATSLNNLGGLFYDQGRYAEAEPFYRRGLIIVEKTLGPNHPNTASSLNNLALLYKREGRYNEAEPLYRRALATFEATLGPNHPNTATCLRNYADLLRKLNRPDEADALEARSKAAGR